MYLERLQTIRALCLASPFFSSHELIGSSLLFVHDNDTANVWMIDFEKTHRVTGQPITHHRAWEVGNHEDGYLTGLDSAIDLLTALLLPSHTD